jgi:glycosyltransferase involved in cell wall biosynthesis
VLVGGDWRGGLARAQAAAVRLGITGDVRFLGWVDDAVLPALYRGARAHVLSTEEETFGKSIAEAMACGCPCVLQDLPVLREVAGGAAELVDFTDTDSAAMALEKICLDDALAARLRAAGLARAAEFSYEKLARERVAAILSLSASRR